MVPRMYSTRYDTYPSDDLAENFVQSTSERCFHGLGWALAEHVLAVVISRGLLTRSEIFAGSFNLAYVQETPDIIGRNPTQCVPGRKRKAKRVARREREAGKLKPFFWRFLR